MTLHASKGLEFPVVFIVALEEGLLPHERSRDNDEQLEEERRLLFVGITRAREELQLSLATYREFRGQRRAHGAQPVPDGAAARRDGRRSSRRRSSRRRVRGRRMHDQRIRPTTSSCLGRRQAIERGDVEEPPRRRRRPRRPRVLPLTTAAELARTETAELPARLARRLSPGHGRAASRVRLGQDRGLERQRRSPHRPRWPSPRPAGQKKFMLRKASCDRPSRADLIRSAASCSAAGSARRLHDIASYPKIAQLKTRRAASRRDWPSWGSICRSMTRS